MKRRAAIAAVFITVPVWVLKKLADAIIDDPNAPDGPGKRKAERPENMYGNEQSS